MLFIQTIESYYILWRTTGDPKWRERGWDMFHAIEAHAKVKDTYASIQNVNKVPPPGMDDLPSFFFAETYVVSSPALLMSDYFLRLKYAYLLFTDEDLIPLDKWTFNTEAHPFPVFTWSPWEKEYFGID